MSKFICQNKNCSNFNKVESFQKLRYEWNPKTMRLEADESFCSVCKEYRNPEKEGKGWTNAWFKAESNRNYDNKKVKQFDYDRSYTNTQTIKIPSLPLR